ncbi:hypothetical protein J5N97_000036 [Dioscorea zingiberensis]|uniref:Uncharacterized protein n=1 Tax=Dioscorea zingiberensis TaxID=325984 RepID=A0A9D5BVL5_9LILI|nr:hypothetical protein J5N97_000036 [Dioscorea zingiberensis]
MLSFPHRNPSPNLSSTPPTRPLKLSRSSRYRKRGGCSWESVRAGRFGLRHAAEKKKPSNWFQMNAADASDGLQGSLTKMKSRKEETMGKSTEPSLLARWLSGKDIKEAELARQIKFV